MSEAAITALETEIAETEKAQTPTRETIAELQAQLTAGDETIKRNRAAIALLRGETPIPANGRRPTRARPAGSSPANADTEATRQRIVDHLGANGVSRAVDITDAIGIGGPALSKVLKAMVEDGTLTSEGVKRGTKYTLKVG